MSDFSDALAAIDAAVTDAEHTLRDRTADTMAFATLVEKLAPTRQNKRFRAALNQLQACIVRERDAAQEMIGALALGLDDVSGHYAVVAAN